MEARQRRSFTNDYKRQAVDLVASSGRSIGSVAKELGLRDSVLRRWVEQRGAGLEPTVAARRPEHAAAGMDVVGVHLKVIRRTVLLPNRDQLATAPWQISCWDYSGRLLTCP